MRAALVLIATAGMALFVALSSAGLVNGVTMREVALKYAAAMTPAGYAFSIWALVCLGLIGFAAYQLHPSNLERFRSVRTLYIVSCLLNSAWIFFWHREQIALSFVLIALLVLTIAFLYVRLEGCQTVFETWLMQAPLGLYLGWVTSLALMMFVVFLTSLGVAAASSNVLAIVLILAVAALAVMVRIKLMNFFFPLGVGWTLTFIAIRQGTNTPVVVACALGVVTCLVTSGSFVVHLRDSTSE